jgi:hypothetical protein
VRAQVNDRRLSPKASRTRAGRDSNLFWRPSMEEGPWLLGKPFLLLQRGEHALGRHQTGCRLWNRLKNTNSPRARFGTVRSRERRTRPYSTYQSGRSDSQNTRRKRLPGLGRPEEGGERKTTRPRRRRSRQPHQKPSQGPLVIPHSPKIIYYTVVSHLDQTCIPLPGIPRCKADLDWYLPHISQRSVPSYKAPKPHMQAGGTRPPRA